METSIASLYTDLGWLSVTVIDEAVTNVKFVDVKEETVYVSQTLIVALKEIDEYLQGNRQVFTVPLAPKGSAFQLEVWKELCKIPYGTTITYLELAKKIGDEKVIRAAASANGKNPIAILIPCHRVIGTDGGLTGYAGGIARKSWLLNHEKGVYTPTLFN